MYGSCLAVWRGKLVGGLCSMLPCDTGVCCQVSVVTSWACVAQNLSFLHGYALPLLSSLHWPMLPRVHYLVSGLWCLVFIITNVFNGLCYFVILMAMLPSVHYLFMYIPLPPPPTPQGGLGKVCCLHPVGNLMVIIWSHFSITYLVLLPTPSALFVLTFFFLLMNHSPDFFFQKILQYFLLIGFFIWPQFSSKEKLVGQ